MISRHLIEAEVVNKLTEPRDSMPWAQGVGRSNRPAPTNRINEMQAVHA